RWASLDHIGRFVEHDRRLITVYRGGVDLGAGFVISAEEVERDAGAHCGFSILLRNLHISFAEPPRTILPLPTEYRSEHVAELPIEQLELLLRPLPLRMTEE